MGVCGRVVGYGEVGWCEGGGELDRERRGGLVGGCRGEGETYFGSNGVFHGGLGGGRGGGGGRHAGYVAAAEEHAHARDA